MSRFCLKAIKGLLLVLAAVKAHQTGGPVLMKTPLFQIVGGFANDNYWSSSEFDNNNACKSIGVRAVFQGTKPLER